LEYINIKIEEDLNMSILNSVLKVAGTIVESAGKAIIDCAEVIEHECKEYKESEQYAKDKAERDAIKAEMKDNWNKLIDNNKDLFKTYKKNKEDKNCSKYNF
jgi:hypothetical protein